MKKTGFTLSETLITLSIIGIVAVLVLPGVVKDSVNKANIALLQSTVSTLNDAVQNELLLKNTKDVKDITIVTNSQNFMKSAFEYADSCGSKAAKKNPYFNTNYKKLADVRELAFPATASSVLLKNGVAVAMSAISTADLQTVYVDTNGKGSPNVIGVDMFILTLKKNTDNTAGVHSGDIGCPVQPGEEISDSDLMEKCRNYGDECYCALERSGFDPDYVMNFGKKEEDDEGNG